MDNPSKMQEQIHFPQIRTNKHFRIKSTSKEKILLGGDLLTARSKRKSSIDDTKRIFSETKTRKNGSIESCVKIRITKEELQKKFDRRGSGKKIAYESVKTDEGVSNDEVKFVLNHLHTINHEENNNAHRIAHLIDPFRAIGRDRMEQSNKADLEESKFKKEKGEKEGKGKYRCRVNQYIFDHSRKKSGLCSKEQQQSINQFWKNVNESLILGGNQTEEMSKDLREFVQHFPTE